jgi:hypothetical protein
MSITLAAAIGGAIAGAMINLTSYIVGCGISGTSITVEGIAQAVIAGMISGVFGAAAGSVTVTATKALYSAYAAFVAAMYAATNGGNWIIAFGATFSGAFIGSLIDTSAFNALAEAFANYAVALFTGAPAEVISTGVQNMISDPQDTATTHPLPTSSLPTTTATRSYSQTSGGGGIYAVAHKLYA